MPSLSSLRVVGKEEEKRKREKEREREREREREGDEATKRESL